MIVARREIFTGRLLLLVLVAVTLLPFLSLLSAALQPSDSTPLGIEWPSDPQWGNFVDAFNVAQMPALLLVERPDRARASFPSRSSSRRWLGSPSATSASRAAGSSSCCSCSASRCRSRASSRRSTTWSQGLGILNTKWAIILPLIGLYMPFAVFWMRAHFINMPQRALGGGAGGWGDDLGPLLADPRAAGPPAVSALAILLSVWTWNQFLLALVLVEDPLQRTMAGALGAYQGHYATNIPLLCAGSLLILTPTLIVFLLFQRQFISALLQGSLKG